MFAYCTQVLHLSEAEAYRRITVARAARRYEGLLDRLRDGRMHLTGMALIVPVLKPENYESLLARATHRSKLEIQELVAELRPRPDVRGSIRRLPQKRVVEASFGAQASGSQSGSEPFPGTVRATDGMARATSGQDPAVPELLPETVGTSEGRRSLATTGPELGGPGLFPETVGMQEGTSRTTSGPEHGGLELFPETVEASGTGTGMATLGDAAGRPTGPLARPKAQTRRATIEPLSPARYKVQFTASQELRDKLARLTALMRSEVPDGDLAAIVERAVSEKLQRLDARRFGKTKAPRKTLAGTVTTPGSRRVPAALRRAVYERDEGRCTYVDQQRRRCAQRHRLEFHHDFPFCKGGDTSLLNLKLFCEQHNRYLAEVDYGKATVQARVQQRLSKKERPIQRDA
jgi:5-methylcytosine-specific restriction endonuclease McrA